MIVRDMDVAARTGSDFVFAVLTITRPCLKLGLIELIYKILNTNQTLYARLVFGISYLRPVLVKLYPSDGPR